MRGNADRCARIGDPGLADGGRALPALDILTHPDGVDAAVEADIHRVDLVETTCDQADTRAGVDQSRRGDRMGSLPTVDTFNRPDGAQCAIEADVNGVQLIRALVAQRNRATWVYQAWGADCVRSLPTTDTVYRPDRVQRAVGADVDRVQLIASLESEADGCAGIGDSGRADRVGPLPAGYALDTPGSGQRAVESDVHGVELVAPLRPERDPATRHHLPGWGNRIRAVPGPAGRTGKRVQRTIVARRDVRDTVTIEQLPWPRQRERIFGVTLQNCRRPGEVVFDQ